MTDALCPRLMTYKKVQRLGFHQKKGRLTAAQQLTHPASISQSSVEKDVTERRTWKRRHTTMLDRTVMKIVTTNMVSARPSGWMGSNLVVVRSFAMVAVCAGCPLHPSCG